MLGHCNFPAAKGRGNQNLVETPPTPILSNYIRNLIDILRINIIITSVSHPLHPVPSGSQILIE